MSKNVWTDCEPTYEELKLRLMREKERIEKENCEPTYEELKHFQFLMRNNHRLNCEPTYEELKLSCLNWS
jgi:hypothetical protein